MSRKGLTTIPSKIRKTLGIKSEDKLNWRVVKKNDKTLIEVEAKKIPIRVLGGQAEGPRCVL